MYEESIVPERLPGGGGFSIKNLSLYSLYQDHIYGHNIWTKTNTHYPLVRYLGCSLKFYQSQDIDYVVTYNTTWPLKSSLLMYNSMQPSIHLMQKQKIIVPSKQTQRRHKPYIKKFILPPTQMQNKWYFQQDLAKTPLFMLKTSSLSLDHYYIGSRMTSTNITIYSLNMAVIQHRDFGNRNTKYYCRTLGTQLLYLYVTKETTKIEETDCRNIIYLGNTQDYLPGLTYNEVKSKSPSITPESYDDPNYRGNPFFEEYLHNDEPVYTSPFSPTDYYAAIKNGSDTSKGKTPKQQNSNTANFTALPLGIQVRYNPYTDNGTGNKCYFLPAKQNQHGWDAPSDHKLTNENLPLWILLFGFPDFQKKQALIHNIDTEYILVLNTIHTHPQKTPLIPISYTFWEGQSPYEPRHNEIDSERWYLSYQYQQEMVNNICVSGPGTPKIPDGTTVEAKVKYTFHFKWGGELPPMSTLTDPTEQERYPIPNNDMPTNSLQNPTTAAETYLYHFDERRGQLTEKAAKRLQKDWETKAISLLSAGPRFAEQTATQETQTESSSEEEEETENLLLKLRKQRLKHKQLKQRIIQHLKLQQKLE